MLPSEWPLWVTGAQSCGSSGREVVDMPLSGEGAGYLGTSVPEKTLGQRKAGGGPWHAGRQGSTGEGV